MNTGHPWLDGMHNHSCTLDDIAARVAELSRAFYRTGNLVLGEELSEITVALRTQADTARTLTASKVNGDYREAVQGTANVIKACLAGAEKERKSRPVEFENADKGEEG